MKFSGCSIPEPANCTLSSTTPLSERMLMMIGEGLGLSAGHVVVRFKQSAGSLPFVTFRVSAGGTCTIRGETLAFEGDGVLAEAVTPAQSLTTQEFLFEPRTRTDVQLYSTGASGYSQAATGFRVGTAPATLTGTISFQVEGIEPFGLY